MSNPAPNPMKETPDDSKFVFEGEVAESYAEAMAEKYGDRLTLADLEGTGENKSLSKEDIESHVAKLEIEDGEYMGKIFESEDVLLDAIDSIEAGDFTIDDLEGTGDNGIVTEGDLMKALDEAKGAAIDYASPAAQKDAEEALASGALSPAQLAAIKGTAKSGGVNTADVKKAIEDAQPAPAGKDEEPAAGDSEGETTDDVKQIISDLVSFGVPVKGALKNKPKVQEAWLDLYKRAAKVLPTL